MSVERGEPQRLMIALDYNVLDHLERIKRGVDVGSEKDALLRLRASAEGHRIIVWLSEITRVEMLHGQENVQDDEEKLVTVVGKDAAKEAMAERMFARWLMYPCGRCDDTYSRVGLSLRCAGPEFAAARDLEQRLEDIDGVSPGDARQLVSCAFPSDTDEAAFCPTLDWFVSQDRRLIKALRAAVAAGRLAELEHIRFGSARELVETLPALLGRQRVNISASRIARRSGD